MYKYLISVTAIALKGRKLSSKWKYAHAEYVNEQSYFFNLNKL